MSLNCLAWSFRLPLRGLALKGVLNALADHADARGRCWPSVKRLVLYTGGDDRTVRKALKKLETLGHLRRTSRPGRSDLYELAVPPLPNQGRPPSQKWESNRQEAPVEHRARARKERWIEAWEAQP